MAREIKFRGKVKHHDPMTNPENGWVEGYYLQDLTQGEMRSYIFQPPCCWEVIPETVGQFTGQYDKNDKEVYEGDVLRFYDEDIPSEVVFAFVDGALMAVYTSALDVRSSWPVNDMVIIGNIHDNPELQKGGAE